MLRPNSTMSAATSKIIVVLAFLCLMIAAIFGLLGSYKVDALRTEVASANAARELGGSLSVASDGLGTGATFTLKLPVSRGGS